MNEALQKFKETVNNAKSIAVRIGATKDISKILSFCALHCAFLDLGKKSSIDIENATEKTLKFLEALLGNQIKERQTQPQNTLIKIDTEKIPVSELKYEKEGNIIKIILSSSENFDKNNIQIEKEKTPVDLLILGDSHEKEIEELLNQTPHKEVVKISSKEKRVEQKIFEIISVLLEGGAEKYKEALWIALENLDPLSIETVGIKKEVLSLKPDFKKISEVKEIIKGSEFWKLLGRALQRSEFEKNHGIVWSFLTSADFEKIQQNEEIILPLFDEIKKMRCGVEFFAFLWEFPRGAVKAMVSGNDMLKLKNFASEMGSSLSSPYFLADGFSSFSEAEIKIRGGIKKVIQ